VCLQYGVVGCSGLHLKPVIISNIVPHTVPVTAVCCSVLQCAVVGCSVLQCVAVCCSGLQCGVVGCSVLQCVAVCCSRLQCVAVCCSALQCVATCRTCFHWQRHAACDSCAAACVCCHLPCLEHALCPPPLLRYTLYTCKYMYMYINKLIYRFMYIY